jgi:hypothetical protein
MIEPITKFVSNHQKLSEIFDFELFSNDCNKNSTFVPLLELAFFSF